MQKVEKALLRTFSSQK